MSQDEMGGVFSAISVILVFVTVAFNMIMPNVWYEIGRCKEVDYKANLAKYQPQLMDSKIFPVRSLFLFCTLIAWLLTPETFSVLSNCKFEWWNFNLTNTLFVIIWFAVLAMAWLSGKALFNLLEISKEIKGVK